MITSPSTGANAKAWDFVEHFYHTQAWLPKNVVVVNERAFRQLDPVVQGTVLGAAAAAERRGWEMSRAETEAKLALLETNGMRVAAPSPELTNGLEAIGRVMAEEWMQQAGSEAAPVLDAFTRQSGDS
jgi:TRAP-type C4-dicarboxylate transport system substrate-binding protein